jgi:hypothetical protein
MARAQDENGPQKFQQAGIWEIDQFWNECVAFSVFADLNIAASLHYPRPGSVIKPALILNSRRYFRDAREGQPYPLHLSVTTDSGVDAGWQEVVPTGLILGSDAYGIFISAPSNFTDSLARAEALQLDMGSSKIVFPVKDMPLMIDALRKCAAAQ